MCDLDHIGTVQRLINTRKLVMEISRLVSTGELMCAPTGGVGGALRKCGYARYPGECENRRLISVRTGF